MSDKNPPMDFLPCVGCPYLNECPERGQCVMTTEEWSLGIGAMESWAFVKWLAQNHSHQLRMLAVEYAKARGKLKPI